MVGKYLKEIWAPFLSLSLVIVGHGLATTYATICMHRAHFSVQVIGFISACYYLGLVMGSFRVEHFVSRVGHIRAYAAFLSIFISVTLICSLWIEPFAWGFLRFIYGVCAAGFFVVIESWFLSESHPSVRGQILSLYMISYYGSYSLGQYLLHMENYLSQSLFIVTAILGGLSIFPLATTNSRQPEVSQPENINLLQYLTISPSAVISAFTGGLFTSVILSLFPLYIAENAGSSAVPHLMAMIIIGGMLFQYPIGKLSDLIDRRKIVLIAFIITGAFTLYCFYHNPINASYAELLFIVFGGVTSVLYPLGINIMCDNVSSAKTVAATQAMLLFYSIGCVLGPILAPMFGDNKKMGLFLFIATCSFSALTLILLRLVVSKPVASDDKIEHVTVAPIQTAAAPELINPEFNRVDTMVDKSIYEQC